MYDLQEEHNPTRLSLRNFESFLESVAYRAWTGPKFPQPDHRMTTVFENLVMNAPDNEQALTADGIIVLSTIAIKGGFPFRERFSEALVDSVGPHHAGATRMWKDWYKKAFTIEDNLQTDFISWFDVPTDTFWSPQEEPQTVEGKVKLVEQKLPESSPLRSIVTKSLAMIQAQPR
ncbi:MAG: hypothetical protein WC612_05680 [Bdellovibrionales bacterium]|jgi:hypothetical protein